MIHRSFEQELVDSLKKGGISVVDFNPLTSSIIMDPKHATMTTTEKETMAKDIHQRRILRTCLQMPQAYLSFAVMRYFSSDHYEGSHKIPLSMLVEYQKHRPVPIRRH